MAKMHAIAGERFYIGNAVISDKDTDFVESDFSSVTWVEVTGWTQRGASGDKASMVSSEQIGADRTKKAKGTRNAGTMENTFDRNDDDAGQALLKVAAASDDNYPFKVVDKLRASQSTPATRLFVGLVMGVEYSSGGPNDPDRISATTEINSNIVPVAAT